MAIVAGAENDVDASTDRSADVIQEETPRRVAAFVPVLLMAVALFVVVPSLRVEWRSLSDFTSMSTQGPGHEGYVTVVSCSRGTLVFDWTCRGLFQVNDFMSDDYPRVENVTVVNDAHFLSAGSRVDVKLASGSHKAYLWSLGQQLRVLAFWAGVALCLMAGLVTVPRRLRRLHALSLVPLLAGVGLLIAFQPLW